MQTAAAHGHIEIVKFLFQHGAHANIQGGQYGNALQAAAARGHAGTVKLLLERGAEPNILGRGNQTALYEAAGRGHTETVQILIEGAPKSTSSVRATSLAASTMELTIEFGLP